MIPRGGGSVVKTFTTNSAGFLNVDLWDLFTPDGFDVLELRIMNPANQTVLLLNGAWGGVIPDLSTRRRTASTLCR